ncbi:Membrane protein insertase YidC [Rhodobacteraceae bacterium THAF1]|uniref:membrane protein insertase YidC n=1 Tax=Palleronia sp. THAF1 TaxID=2587842 RepID=UPI000F415744|nr:membrane protein insertase YidC [Palleronia sp. THAF1]QFU07676.1 Membrane protein insertase YidC [Palleronia sp. THAF1]VDC23127.1 Membrane protein insertase YidC [Rhodobacteraceae bacterium THAF1]
MDDQNKNLILATVLSFLVIVGWMVLFPPEESTTVSDEVTAVETPQNPASAPAPPGSDVLAATGTGPDAVATDAPRLDIDTPALSGSVSLVGGRIDELALKRYNVEVDPSSPIVDLLNPVGSNRPYYALFGWAPGGDLAYEDVPSAQTPWEVVDGDTLSVDSPVTLEWDNGNGLLFTRTLSVDDNYMFTIDQSVENTTNDAVRMAPYGTVARHGDLDLTGFFILHEGVVRMSDSELQEIDYDDLPDLDQVAREGGPADVIEVQQDGWIGFTDKYWMTALIPEPGTSFTSVAKFVDRGEIYQSEARLPALDIAAGETAQTSMQLFAGAKDWDIILGYQRDGIDRFTDSIDWGWFFFLTKPIFVALHWLNGVIGNMGWSIILLTLGIKAILLPLAYKSYVSMARMKELQPQMEALKEKAGDDREKLQKGMMELYKTNKVNPAAGCLPILLQIPIFFSLYKVIFVTLELRHAPWFGWIRDLSAPDPSSILNLFGLLPWGTPDPASFIAIISLGILPILLGVSMWLQQKLNPAPADPTQAMIFAWMPWVFMFMLGQFASGLVIYWIANNTITFIQQYVIMRSQGVKPDILGNVLGRNKQPAPAAANKTGAPKKKK